MKAGQLPTGDTYTFANPCLSFYINWNPGTIVDDVNYYTQITLDGSNEEERVSTGASTYVWKIWDKVVNGTDGTTTESFTFHVKTIERATGNVVSSTTAATIGPIDIGWCSPLR
jgi:hypothetical protein